MTDHIKREMRYFRNHYLCDDCTRSGSEWSTEMAVVAADHCPNCDRRCEPYDSEALLENIKLAPDEAVETLVEMLQDAGILGATKETV